MFIRFITSAIISHFIAYVLDVNGLCRQILTVKIKTAILVLMRSTFSFHPPIFPIDPVFPPNLSYAQLILS